MKKKFDFVYQMTAKGVRDLKIVTEIVGTLHVTGTATVNTGCNSLDDILDRYTIDLDGVYFNGMDVTPLLEWSWKDDDIKEAAAAYVHNEIMNQLIAA